MIVSSIYKPILKLTIHHNYFLNDGEIPFTGMSDGDKRKQLERYDFNGFLAVNPSPATSSQLAGNKMIIKYYKDHIILALKVTAEDHKQPYIELSGEEAFVFTVDFVDPFFGNYTKLENSGAKLMYFSNKTPDLPDPVVFQAIHREQENEIITEEFLFSGDNKTALLEQSNVVQSNPNGIIKLYLKGDNGALSIIQNNGKLKNNLPHFKIHFDNQKTIWKYIHHSAGFEVETKQEKPLTHFGFIQLESPADFKAPPPDLDKYKFPNPSARQVKKIGNKFYSEIFI